MPLFNVRFSSETFSDAVRDTLAQEFIVIALEGEHLPVTPFEKSTT